MDRMQLSIKKQTLPNGLKLVVNEDTYSTMVAAAIIYYAGSRTEEEGNTGISHILEHMMFKGTEKMAPEDYSKVIQKMGGYDNAYTSKDYTAFYAYLPISGLETFISMEADRMVNLKIRDFDEEMEIIKDERRYTTLDNPVEFFMEKFWLNLFQTHPYRFPVVGFMEDLEKMTLEKVLGYYNAFYTPANAMIAVAGNVAFEEVLDLVFRYFGNISKNGNPKKDIPVEPEQKEKRFFKLKKKNVSPIVAIGFKTIPFGHESMYAFDLLSEVLCGGKWGILVKELVYEQNLFTSLNCESSYLRDHGLFSIIGLPAPGQNIFRAAEILEKKLRNSENRIEEEMLYTAKNKLLTEFYFNMESVRDVVFELAEFELSAKAEDVLRYPEGIRRVTIDEIRSLIGTHFTEEKETLGVLHG
jgi:zinc protease